MYLSGVFSIAATLFTLSSAAPTVNNPKPVSYDPGYDDSSRSLSTVSCSNGENGLMTRYGWDNQGQVANFPSIGGVSGITWNSPLCGTCWQLTYNGRTIFVLGVDAAYNDGFNIGLGAMNNLTNGNAVELGKVWVDYAPVGADRCGL